MKFMDSARRAIRDLTAGRIDAFGKVLSLVLLAFLAFLAWRSITGGNNSQSADMEIEVPNIPLDGGVADDLDELKRTAKSILEQITDESSARQAVPKLKEVNSSLNSLIRRFQLLPSSVKPALRADATDFWTEMQVHIARVYAIPGIQTILDLVANDLLHNLETMNKPVTVPVQT